MAKHVAQYNRKTRKWDIMHKKTKQVKGHASSKEKAMKMMAKLEAEKEQQQGGEGMPGGAGAGGPSPMAGGGAPGLPSM